MKLMPIATSVLLGIILAQVSPVPVFATDCSAWSQFSSRNPKLEPGSVSISHLQDYVNGLDTSEGVIFDIELKDTDLWVDVVYVPDNATAISGLRAIMQIGRLVSGDFSRLVLADKGVGIYQISEPILKEVGCQFIWGEEGGQNPIYLMRVFFQELESFPSGNNSVPGFTGALLPDTSLAMQYHNEVFLRQWLLSALQ